jgi:hypothetical protein
MQEAINTTLIIHGIMEICPVNSKNGRLQGEQIKYYDNGVFRNYVN